MIKTNDETIKTNDKTVKTNDKMIRINEIDIALGADISSLKNKVSKIIGVPVCDFLSFEVVKESIDSRKKNNIRMVYSVNIDIMGDKEALVKNFSQNKVSLIESYKYEPPQNKRKSKFRPVVIGFGPAGMLCAYMLAKAGLKPIVLERGKDVDQRIKDVGSFWQTKRLNPSSNVQFGEGGAGTFSDGKLNTGIKDLRVRKVIDVFLEHGAPKEIKYSARPHIGTDKLCDLVKNIRKEIIDLGGEVLFEHKLESLIIANEYVHGLRYSKNGKSFDIETDCIALCIGHSARDTFEVLYNSGVKMQQKAFSVGTRIEHPQELINRSQYGKFYNHPLLPPAEYKLSNHSLHKRGAYTFCMCPGGTVVLASSEENMVVVNGMSQHKRDGQNANSAILSGIEPEFFASEHPLAGIWLQREIESAAFVLGDSSYAAPAQKLGDFLKNQPSKKLGSVFPSCPTGVVMSDIRKCLPSQVTDAIASAIYDFDKKLKGFAMEDAVLTAPESRSSSPVRILRDEFFQSNIRRLYPCGEGAGYAGGISSAAADGIRVAEAILKDEDGYFNEWT